MNVQEMKQGNRKFLSEFAENSKLYRSLVEEGQHPKVLWVGCSDSRVVPEFIVKAKAGDLFVHRNIANIVPANEFGESCTASVLEYAVLELKVEHIVICGHTGCGGINALVGEVDEGTNIASWLANAKPAKEKHIQKADFTVLDVIKENILLQKKNLLTYEYIKRSYRQKKLNIHLWLYDMSDGKISFFDEEKPGWFLL